MTSHADVLFERIVATGDERAANDLLTEFSNGYPVEKLEALLHSPDDRIVKAGTWIASELGAAIRPLLSAFSSLLEHPTRYVRFFAIDAVLGAASADHGSLIAQVIALVNDADSSIRWKALHFLRASSRNQVEASRPHIGDPGLAENVTWFLRGLSGGNLEETVRGLQDKDSSRQRFAVALAARAEQQDDRALQAATGSTNEDVATFAQEVLNRRR